MRLHRLIVCLAALLAAAELLAEGLASRHVVFDNSDSIRGHYHSAASVVAPSRLAIESDKAPVATDRFVSPPNALLLSWTSAPGGDWRVEVRAPARYGRRLDYRGDALAMWVFSEEGLTAEASPRVSLRSATGGLPTIDLLERHGNLPKGNWVRIVLPLEAFRSPFGGVRDEKFRLDKLEALTLVQGLDDGEAHALWIDDIQVVDAASLSDTVAPSPPQGLTLRAHERHFELAWEAAAETDLLHYSVERSIDNEPFAPVQTRAGWSHRCADFVTGPGVRASYRAVAVDLAGNASAPSEAVSGTTRAFTDDELMTMVQEGSFRYYWEAANRDSGMAVEILPGDENLVALGASGFGLTALVVGAERGFATREAVALRVAQILHFLENADRFHGVWPHFLDGKTGRAVAYFGPYDNGGDLVETAFLAQGLLVARQYFDRDTPLEREVREKADALWRGVEWDWHRKTPDSDVLFWHWSPDHSWHISHPLIGWNETMIVYLLAIASPTHGVPAEMFHTGFAGQSEAAVAYRRNWSRTTQGDHYTNGADHYGHRVEVGSGRGGELFFQQFSFLGFDPRGKRDRYTNYFRNARSVALVSHAYAQENPRGWKGYGADCWGQSAGINAGGGRAQPRDDNGTICTSASVGLMPFTPEESMRALRHYYRDLGPKVWGVYGFHDGFNASQDWYDEVYMGLNQAQIVTMIENHRTGLVWDRFMASPEIGPALQRMGFARDY